MIGEERLIATYKQDLDSKYKMKNLILMSYFMGMEVWHDDVHIFMRQGKYETNILKVLKIVG